MTEDHRRKPPRDRPPKAKFRSGSAAVGRQPGKPGFFHIYKKGQGYWTRMGTVAGVGLIGSADRVHFLYRSSTDSRRDMAQHLLQDIHLQEPTRAYLLVGDFRAGLCGSLRSGS